MNPRNLIFAICCAAFVFVPDIASAYLFGGAPTAVVAPPFPTTQTVAFGANTLFGHGGSTLQYTNQAALGVSRWLKITAQVNNAATPGTYYGIDDRNMLVPCAAITSNLCSSTYGGTVTRSATPYTVTIAEYSDSGRTTPTGNQSVVTVNTTGNVYTIREMTAAADGCINPITGTAVNCEVTNPDADGSFQLNTVLGLALSKTTDSVVARDGWFDPNRLLWGLSPTITNYTGSGTIVVSSETKDIGTVDSLGNPRLQNGFKYGLLYLKASNSGDVIWPIKFDYLQQISNGTASPPFMGWSAGIGRGVTLTHTRITVDCGISFAFAAFQMHADFTASNNTVDSCASKNGGIPGDSIFNIDASAWLSDPSITAYSNAFENLTDDAFQISGCNADIRYNYSTGAREPTGSGGHADSLQHVGLPDGTTVCPFGTVFGNMAVNGAADSTGAGPQGFPFIKNDVGAGTGQFSSADIIDNMNLIISDSDCQFYSRVNNLNTQGNVNLAPPQTTTPNPLAVGCNSLINVGGVNATAIGNVSNSFNLTGQTGSITNTHNPTIAFTNNSTGCNNIKAKFANFVCGDDPLNTNRTYGLGTVKPANRTDTANGDGTFLGPVWPQMDGGEWCFAVSATVVDFTKTCVQNGTIPIQ